MQIDKTLWTYRVLSLVLPFIGLAAHDFQVSLILTGISGALGILSCTNVEKFPFWKNCGFFFGAIIIGLCLIIKPFESLEILLILDFWFIKGLIFVLSIIDIIATVSSKYMNFS